MVELFTKGRDEFEAEKGFIDEEEAVGKGQDPTEGTAEREREGEGIDEVVDALQGFDEDWAETDPEADNEATAGDECDV